MRAHKSWLRRLDKLEAGLPVPPAGAPYWLQAFEVIGVELGLARRDPDFAAALAAYRATRPGMLPLSWSRWYESPDGPRGQEDSR